MLQETLTPIEEEVAQLPPSSRMKSPRKCLQPATMPNGSRARWCCRQSILLVLFACASMAWRSRPARRIYIKLDQFGRATPVKYSDLEHYTPDAAVAKTYLRDWAMFRFRRLRASVLKTFPKNYLVSRVEVWPADQGSRSARERCREHPGRPRTGERCHDSVDQSDLVWETESWPGHCRCGNGGYRSAEDVHQRRDHAPADVDHRGALLSESRSGGAASEDHPDYQTINPLGLTIVEFIANRANVEATQK